MAAGAEWATLLKSETLYRVIAVLLVIIAGVLLLAHNTSTAAPAFTGWPRSLLVSSSDPVIGVIASLLGVAAGGRSLARSRRLARRNRIPMRTLVYQATELALSQQSMQLRPAGYSRAGLLYIRPRRARALSCRRRSAGRARVVQNIDTLEHNLRK
jgi:hypothetical protein